MKPASLVLAAALLALAGCRDGTARGTGFQPVASSAVGANGCNGANNTFTAPVQVYLDAAVVGAMSQLAASATEDKVYVSGADGSIQELDFTGNALAPVVTQVLVPGPGPGSLDAFLGAIFAGPPPAVISGLALLDPATLVVVEHTSNTLLLVNIPTGGISLLAGFPDLTPSYVDGNGGTARFSFLPTVPTQLCPTGDGRIFVADSGNHALRQLTVGAIVEVATVAGTGIPFHSDGSAPGIGLDTPVGVVVNCNGEVLVTEVGAMGQRLRSIAVGGALFFGGIQASSMTVAGDGTNATVQGAGVAASLAAPVSPVVTQGSEVYWIDSGSGVVRRLTFATGIVDCPLFVDCATATGAGGSFSGAANYSATVTPTGVLYVLDGAANAVYAVGS